MRWVFHRLFLWSVLATLFFLSTHSVFSAGLAPKKKSKEIRILLQDNADQLTLRVDGPFSLWDCAKKSQLLSKRKGTTLQFQAQGGILTIGKKSLDASDVILFPKDGSLTRFNGKKFRGRIRITVDGGSKLDCINVVDLEEYLKSVVGGEISAGWPAEALKAQAIAARTYAYYHLLRNHDKSAHLNNPLAQNYQGVEQEDSRTTGAVEETRGAVLNYRGYLFPSFFHSTCGGGTEFPQNVWPLHFRLPEIVPCDYCKASPYFRWQVSLSLQEMEQKFKEAGISVEGKLASLYPSRISKNRVSVTEVMLVTDRGEKAVRVNDFRRALGYNFIRSARFKVNTEEERAVFTGWGWGHGVGMCQWGARELALQQHSCRDILRYYYPGCTVKRVKL